MPLVVLIPVLAIWEGYTRSLGNALVPPPSKVVAELPNVILDPAVIQGLATSDLALLIGYAGAALVGVPLGLLMGRVRLIDTLTRPLINIAMVTPVVVVMPVLIIIFGISHEAQEVIIFVFALPFVAVPCRAGARAVPRELIEMCSSFGASELQIWREALLPGSIPAIATGLRLGFGQAITGMVTVELTMLALGIGNVVLDYENSFRSADVFAIVGILIVQSVAVMAILRAVEKRIGRQRGTALTLAPRTV
jgi:ABC-type nitrate/sulfonate/bicarbonate transport system permease component